MIATTLTSADGIQFRDLNGNGTMEPFENPTLPVEVRVADLLGRLSLPEKAGLMFHTVIEAGEDGSVLEQPGNISKSPTSTVVLSKFVNHFNVHVLGDPRMAARWSNNLQALAAQAPHGIPVTVSTDPRHAFIENFGASFTAGAFSQWPESLGLAALRDAEITREYADIVRQEYLAVGIRAALHPTLDLATEPRWARQAQTFGQDAALVGELGRAYLYGLQGPVLGPNSIACCTKHFPGGGPQKDGEDAHFPYGREQVYEGGRFDDHLAPFLPAIEAGTSAIMPYYGMPIGLEINGEKIEEVGFGFNKQVVVDLLRGTLGFDGVVISDWELINDNWVGEQVLPARAWGVEHLDPEGRMELLLAAGADQFGGEECTEVLLRLVEAGRVTEDRIDESVRRLLTVKFQLGLFENPFVDEDAATEIVGRPDFRAKGFAAQVESITVLANEAVDGTPVLPLRAGAALYLENVDPAAAVAAGFTVADDPAEADVALVRLAAPFEPRSDLFLESYFHQGSLDFPPGLVVRMARLADVVPLVIDVSLDRPAILTPLVDVTTGLVASYGSSDRALFEALTGRTPPRGKLPVDIPRSMEAVRQTPEDEPGSRDPLFRFGDGLSIG